MATRYVHVPQEDGVIVLGITGEQRTYRIDNHIASARTREEEDELLLLVDGARRATTREVRAAKGERQQPAPDDTPADEAGAASGGDVPAGDES